jgi:hypothetical protein
LNRTNASSTANRTSRTAAMKRFGQFMREDGTTFDRSHELGETMDSSTCSTDHRIDCRYVRWCVKQIGTKKRHIWAEDHCQTRPIRVTSSWNQSTIQDLEIESNAQIRHFPLFSRPSHHFCLSLILTFADDICGCRRR